MCFTPYISLTTAVIEFSLGLIILLWFKKSVVSRFGAALVLMLGLYQFTEFMLCVTNQAVLWATLGYVTYTFLPAIGVHFTVRYMKLKINAVFIYLLPIIFAIVPLLAKEFITGGSCQTLFISVKNIFFWEYRSILFFYLLYYFGYITIICFLLWRRYLFVKNKVDKKVTLLWFGGLLLVTIPAVVLIVILPAFSVVFPSMYCEFALVFAVMVFTAAYLEQKK